MAKYIIKRLIITIPIIVLVVFFVYTLLYFTPGDPAVIILGDQASTEELDSMREYLGIDQPYIVQLGQYFYKLITFNLGESWIYKTNVSWELANRMPRTTAICIYSVLIGAVIGIPLGVIAAVNQNRLPDKIVLASSSILTCVPNYCIALLLILAFCLKLGWFNVVFNESDGLKAYLLPCISILIGSFAGTARQMRSSMLEVIRSDYVTAARAQGFSRNSVYYRHALPNAMIPIITMMGTQFAAGLGGTMILETIFNIPGVGLYVSGAITNRDRPVIIGSTVFLGTLFCLIMLGIDIVYAIVDPRIRAQYEAQGSRRKRRKKAA